MLLLEKRKYPSIGFLTNIENVRGIVEGNYIVFYKIEKDQIEIITIWDTRKEPQTMEIQ
jgi:hypothetical protein